MPRSRRAKHHQEVGDGVKVKKYPHASKTKGGLSKHVKPGVITVVADGEEEYALIPRRTLEALYDTIELQADPEAVADIREHRAQQARGESDTVSHEEALALLRAVHPSR